MISLGTYVVNPIDVLVRNKDSRMHACVCACVCVCVCTYEPNYAYECQYILVHGGVAQCTMHTSNFLESNSLIVFNLSATQLVHGGVNTLSATQGVFYDDEVRTTSKRQKPVLWKALIFSCLCYV